MSLDGELHAKISIMKEKICIVTGSNSGSFALDLGWKLMKPFQISAGSSKNGSGIQS